MMDSVVAVVAIIICIMMTTWKYDMFSGNYQMVVIEAVRGTVEISDQLRGQVPVGKVTCTRPRLDASELDSEMRSFLAVWSPNSSSWTPTWSSADNEPIPKRPGMHGMYSPRV